MGKSRTLRREVNKDELTLLEATCKNAHDTIVVGEFQLDRMMLVWFRVGLTPINFKGGEKMLAIVIANKGFQSARMPLVNAVIYARKLEQLGNVSVKVEVIK